MSKKIISFMIAIYMICSMTVFANTAITIPAISYSNENYTFRLKGSTQEFILLDEGTTSTSKFLIMAKGYYGKMPYHAGGESKFDPENPQSMAYFLNDDFLKFGNRSDFTLQYYKLPQQVIEHIDKEHIWECEHGKTGSDADKAYTVQCGVAIPSQTELLKYADKIGWDDDFTSRENDVSIPAWGVRSTFNHGELMAVSPGMSMDKLTAYGKPTNAIGIRPVFWVDLEFFGDVELDLDTMGKGVAEVFKKYYTIDEFHDMYSLQECYDYLGYKSPLTIKKSGEGIINIKNNYKEDIYALMLTVFYDEGHFPLRQEYKPVFVKGGEEINVEKSIELDSAVYAKTKIVEKTMPYSVISNSLSEEVSK